MDVAALVERFGLPEQMRPWLAETARLTGGAALPLPARERAAATLRPFALADEDADEVIGHWPDRSWPQELRGLVACMYARIAADRCLPAGHWRHWPSLAHLADPRVRCAPVYALAAALPLAVGAHQRRGIDPRITRATLADVGLQMERSRAMFRQVSLETADWVALQFRGGLFQLGVLQYEPGVHETAGRESGEPESGTPVLRLHVPGGLDPRGVDASLGRARRFFGDHFGVDYAVAMCTSWLLDPQLGEYLPADSNIMAFQRRFALLGCFSPGDGDVFRFVFGMRAVDPEAAERRTRLQRAIVDHLCAGRHWRVGTGYLGLP